MKTKDKLIATLNLLLVNKLTAINQYMVDSEICENSGYHKLQQVLHKLATDQMLLAEWLIDRISFLDGSNTLSKLSSLMIEKTVSEMMSNFNNPDAFQIHNDALILAQEADDEITARLLTKIIKMEDVNIDWAEIQHEQSEHSSLENQLIAQTESMAN